MGCDDRYTDHSGTKQLERTRYFSRQLITADDLTQDQIYHREKRRMHNRLLHGWGIVCGLEVKKDPVSPASLIVTICPGYALSPQGDEIYVPTEVKFDYGQCIKGQDAPCHSACAPVAPGAVNPAKDFYIAIKFTECLSHPVRVPPVGCGCDDTQCEYSRIRDGFELTCLGSLPDSHSSNSQAVNMLHNAVNGPIDALCPPCPDSPWIVLAKVAKGSGLDSPPRNYRRVLRSTAMMQVLELPR